MYTKWWICKSFLKKSKISEPMIHCPRTMTPSTRADVPKRMRVYPNATICQLINPYWDLVATLPFPYCTDISYAHVQHKWEGCSLAELEISCSGNLQKGKLRNNLPQKSSCGLFISQDFWNAPKIYLQVGPIPAARRGNALSLFWSAAKLHFWGWAVETSSHGEDVAKNSGHLLLDISIL